MQALASGYALGELLHRLNLQPDFAKFDSTGTPDAMINNFTRLYPTFKHLGVKLDSNVANALIRQEKGVATRLLYAIKRVRMLAETRELRAVADYLSDALSVVDRQMCLHCALQDC